MRAAWKAVERNNIGRDAETVVADTHEMQGCVVYVTAYYQSWQNRTMKECVLNETKRNRVLGFPAWRCRRIVEVFICFQILA